MKPRWPSLAFNVEVFAVLLMAPVVATHHTRYSQHYDVVVDPGVSTDDAANISVAAALWTAAAGTQFNFDEPRSHRALIGQRYVVYLTVASQQMVNDECAAVRPPHTDLLACTDMANLNVYFIAGADVRVLTHELGHALGLRHDVPGTTMSVVMEATTPYGPTREDVRQYWALRIFDF